MFDKSSMMSLYNILKQVPVCCSSHWQHPEQRCSSAQSVGGCSAPLTPALMLDPPAERSQTGRRTTRGRRSTGTQQRQSRHTVLSPEHGRGRRWVKHIWQWDEEDDVWLSPVWPSGAAACAGRARGTGRDPSAPDSWRRQMKTCWSGCCRARQPGGWSAEPHRSDPLESLGTDRYVIRGGCWHVAICNKLNKINNFYEQIKTYI